MNRTGESKLCKADGVNEHSGVFGNHFDKLSKSRDSRPKNRQLFERHSIFRYESINVTRTSKDYNFN